MNKTLIVAVSALMLAASAAVAQTEISLTSSYEVPLGELKWIYQPGMSYALNVGRVKETRVSRSTTGIEVGYLRFQPKDSVFYYLLSEEEYGTIRYSNYQAIQLSLTLRHDFFLNDRVSLFVGAGVGYYYTFFTYLDDNSFVNTDAQVIEGRAGISPRVGVNVLLSESVGLLVQSKYNASIGQPDISSLYNHYLSSGLGVFVRF